MYCTKCREEKEGTATYCDVCGTPLSKRCKECGTVLPAEAVFCTECGSKVEEEASCEMGTEEEQVRFCSECGHELGEETSVCSNCGWGKEEAAKKESINRDEDKEIDSSKNENALDKQYHIQFSGKQMVIGIGVIIIIIIVSISLFMKREEASKISPIVEMPMEKKKEQPIENTNTNEVNTEDIEANVVTLSGMVEKDFDGTYLRLNSFQTILVYDMSTGTYQEIEYVDRVKIMHQINSIEEDALISYSDGTELTVTGNPVLKENMLIIYPSKIIQESSELNHSGFYGEEQFQSMAEQFLEDLRVIYASMFSEAPFETVKNVFTDKEQTFGALSRSYKLESEKVQAEKGLQSLSLTELCFFFDNQMSEEDEVMEVIFWGCWFPTYLPEYDIAHSMNDSYFTLPLKYAKDEEGNWRLADIPSIPIFFDSNSFSSQVDWEALESVSISDQIDVSKSTE